MNELTLPGVGPGIEAGMIAAVAATVFITGAMKGILGLGLTTGSIVVFSILYGVESALSLLIAPTIATNIWQGTTGGHARELLGRFGRSFQGYGREASWSEDRTRTTPSGCSARCWCSTRSARSRGAKDTTSRNAKR